MKILLVCKGLLKAKLENHIMSQFISCELITVCTKEAYEDLNFLKLKIDQVFIYVELDWYSANSINQGYDLAMDLLNIDGNKDRFIQVKFFSLNKQSDLIRSVPGNRYFLSRSFQHIHLLDNPIPAFENYTNEHYEFIKLLALTHSGILLLVKHELSTISQTIADDYDQFLDQKRLVQTHLNSILFLEMELKKYFEINIEELDQTSLRGFLSALTHEIELLNLKESGLKKTEKLNYSVLIVEDNQEMLEALVDICEENFNEVYPSKKELDKYSVKNAREKLKKKGKEYNVIILDLLFAKEDTSYELFSGIDFLKDIKSDFPYLTVRVVTNVSRQIIGPLLDIPIKNLYPKNMGKSALREFIINDIDRIKRDCLAKEKSKALRNTGPKIGYFQFPGIWDYIESLIQSKNFDTFWKNSGLRNFNEFANSERISEFDGKLPSPRRKNHAGSNSEIELYLKNVFTFRLLLLSFLIRGKSLSDRRIEDSVTIEANAIEDFEENILMNICGRKNCDPSFLNMIGLSARQNSVNLSFEIDLSNLFVQERKWLKEKLMGEIRILVADDNPKLAEWFTEIRDLLTNKLEIEYLLIPKNRLDYDQFGVILTTILGSEKLNRDITDDLGDSFDRCGVEDESLPPTIRAKVHAIFRRFEAQV